MIDQEQDLSQSLVPIQRHEEWTISGKITCDSCAEFKRCTARMKGFIKIPVPSPSDSNTSGSEEPGPSVAHEEEGKNAADRATGAGYTPSAQTPSHVLFMDAFLVPRADRIGSPEDVENLTDEEDHHGIGASGWKWRAGRFFSAGNVAPPPGIEHATGKRRGKSC